ncbi:MAG: hypothetical protein ACQKBY_11625 [Verrucomicrobiales bacterium]
MSFPFQIESAPWRELQPTHLPLAGQTTNLGDDVQCAAASILWGVDELVERDAPESWPADALIPLFGWHGHRRWGRAPACQCLIIGLHLTPARREEFAQPHLRRWLADMVRLQGFPAMARDLVTRDFIRALGIDAEFGGCVTLTLAETGKKEFPVKSKLDRRFAIDAPAPEGFRVMTHQQPALPTLPPVERLSWGCISCA